MLPQKPWYPLCAVRSYLPAAATFSPCSSAFLWGPRRHADALCWATGKGSHAARSGFLRDLRPFSTVHLSQNRSRSSAPQTLGAEGDRGV